MATKLSIATEKVGVHLNSDMHEDVCSIMKQEDNEVVKLHPEGSFQRMFWSQQLNASRVQKASAMKWHPLIIKWCLYLRYKSSGAYEALRESGCLKLPSCILLRSALCFFFSDPPHLLKTTRNCLASKARHLWV